MHRDLASTVVRSITARATNRDRWKAPTYQRNNAPFSTSSTDVARAGSCRAKKAFQTATDAQIG